MTAPINPQEIFLLERYASLEYFGCLRDAFAASVSAAEAALSEFISKLPDDYRSRPASLQPDAVWGELVLPNMRWALQCLNHAYIRISHGDLDALASAGNVTTTFSSISREFSWEWMPEPFLSKYDGEKRIASRLSSNISTTALNNWLTGALSSRYNESARGPLLAPTSWPHYQLQPHVSCKSGETVPLSGVFLADVEGSCAQLLIKGHDVPTAAVPDPPADPRITSSARKKFPATWIFVERVADQSENSSASMNDIPMQARCESGHPCPKEGYWFTPAHESSRRFFGVGEIMSSMGGDYGSTIWQRDLNQAK